MIYAALKSQYHASLAMLREAIDTCPTEPWDSAAYDNRYWQVAYHTLYYTHFYLQPDEVGFIAPAQHRQGHHRFEPRPASAGPLIAYSRQELSGYARECDALVDAAVDRLDLTAPGSGFAGYPIPKLEHQLVNLRHLQHHTGQLADRLRHAAGRGVAWVRSGALP